MSDKRQMDWTRRPRVKNDDQHDSHEHDRFSNRRKVDTPPTRYTFHVPGKARPPAGIIYDSTRDRELKRGDVLSTDDGPHRVTEVFWSGGAKYGWRATVRLVPVPRKEKPATTKDEKGKQPWSKRRGAQPAQKPAAKGDFKEKKPARRFDSGHKPHSIKGATRG